LARGQESYTEGRFDERLDLLRRAHQMDERNPAIRTALLENLPQQARRLVDRDWQAADSLAQEALDLDPGHPIAKNVRVLVEDLKRRESIDACVADVRRLQATNDLQGALVQVERALSLYAREDRLVQLRDTIRKELVRASHGQSRQRDLEELRRLDQQAELAADPAVSRTICGAALELAGRYPDDQAFDSLASIFRGRLETISPRTPGHGPQQAPENPPPSRAAATVEVSEALPAPEPAAPQPEPPVDSGSRRLVLLLGVVAAIMVVLAVAWMIHHGK